MSKTGECASCEALFGCSGEPGRRFAADKYAMLGRMIRGLALLIMVVSMTVCSAESVQIITAEDWARPRTGESLVRMPALKRTVRDYLEQKSNQKGSQNDRHGQRISIRHPRGEEGVLWAEELRGWLIALGIPSADIAVSPQSSRIDAVELAVMDADD